MKTLVEYMYRDASNYKQSAHFILEGDFEIVVVQEWLSDGEFFIPERVGVKSLVPAAKTTDDHYFHTLEAACRIENYSAIMSAELFIERVRCARDEGWFYENLSSAERQVALAEGRRTGLMNPRWGE